MTERITRWRGGLISETTENIAPTLSDIVVVQQASAPLKSISLNVHLTSSGIWESCSVEVIKMSLCLDVSGKPACFTWCDMWNEWNWTMLRHFANIHRCNSKGDDGLVIMWHARTKRHPTFPNCPDKSCQISPKQEEKQSHRQNTQEINDDSKSNRLV